MISNYMINFPPFAKGLIVGGEGGGADRAYLARKAHLLEQSRKKERKALNNINIMAMDIYTGNYMLK